MSNNDIRIGILDYEQIKASLKEYFRNQEYWSDYDFEGSGLDLIISLLAANTFMNAYDASVIANEAFLPTAQLRSSVVKHAQMLGYVPRSITAATIYGDVVVEEGQQALPNLLVLPRGSKFKSPASETGQAYDFVVMHDHEASSVGGKWIFENVELRQGSYHIVEYINDAHDIGQKFLLPSNDIDTSLLEVYVQEGNDATQLVKYDYVDDVIDVDGESRVFFLREDRNGKFEVFFGDGVIGRKVNHNALIRVVYFMTFGEEANGINQLQFVSSPAKTHDIDNGIVSFTAKIPSRGGKTPEETENIRFRAPYAFYAQKRAVTERDVEIAVKEIDPSLIVNVWGGEKNEPPAYGKVFISVMSADKNFVVGERKERVVQTLREKYLPPIVYPEVVDPDFIDMGMSIVLKLRKEDIFSYGESLSAKVREYILSEVRSGVEQFSSHLYYSDIINGIVDVDNRILSVSVDMFLSKRIYIQDGMVFQELYFKNTLLPDTLTTTPFLYKGSVSRIVYGGDEKLQIVDSENGNVLNEDCGSVDKEKGIVSLAFENLSNELGNFIVLKVVPEDKDIRGGGNTILRIDQNELSVKAKAI